MQAPASLDRILQLTKDIELATAVGDWPRAADLASERSPLVMSLAAQQPAESIDKLKALLALDRMILGYAETAQSELATEYTRAMRAVRVASQYERVAHL
ncbi:flagellar protein FliT [Paraburkholderia sp. UYCP14C]|uniref:flagellar protein FliT n=1 Tax=Paraburkholderia sp. UYCP14C TaxID=2511130 RepID=UPI0010229250|nr:flagellar protein FliT [Paraburkholderia sp. UYCP14C]RZF28046.1 flagellar protein FliT [Paraburkholderia sp. UYCP14C]